MYARRRGHSESLAFWYMAVVGKISQDFMTIYAVIIAFYFGTQSQKTQDAIDGTGKGV